jgi:hypothetical protein
MVEWNEELVAAREDFQSYELNSPILAAVSWSIDPVGKSIEVFGYLDRSERLYSD